jgi:hypothetical protein
VANRYRCGVAILKIAGRLVTGSGPPLAFGQRGGREAPGCRADQYGGCHRHGRSRDRRADVYPLHSSSVTTARWRSSRHRPASGNYLAVTKLLAIYDSETEALFRIGPTVAAVALYRNVVERDAQMYV